MATEEMDLIWLGERQFLVRAPGQSAWETVDLDRLSSQTGGGLNSRGGRTDSWLHHHQPTIQEMNGYICIKREVLESIIGLVRHLAK